MCNDTGCPQVIMFSRFSYCLQINKLTRFAAAELLYSLLNETLKNHKVRKTKFGEATYFLAKFAHVFEIGCITQNVTDQETHKSQNSRYNFVIA